MSEREALCDLAMLRALSMIKSELPASSNREQLIYLLTEAAELEHGLMCTYLFASFSLRSDAADMSPAEQAAVTRWRKSIREVAVEEMLHLLIVQNLLTSIGGAPHLQRPNFPVSPGLYPSGLVLQLRRLDEATLDHFVYLERPEGTEQDDSEEFQPADDHVRGTARALQLLPSAEEYASVGALYRGIEESFELLTELLGERALFIGNAEAQADQRFFAFESLQAVTSLSSAKAAIAQIIEQGEGGRVSRDTSHYDRFCSIRDEYRRLRAERPGFDPAHPVASNPVMHRPLDPEACALVSAPEASRLSDLANAVYGLTVQLLARFFGAMDDADGRHVLADTAISLMSGALSPLAQQLASLPIGDARPGENAGLTFTLPRSTHALPQRRPAWTLLHERAEQIATACRQEPVSQALVTVGAKVQQVAAQLLQERDRTVS